jgi:hypothetical protein
MHLREITPVRTALLALLAACLMAGEAHAAAPQKIGILYFLWHCPVSTSQAGDAVFDIAKATAGAAPWGPVPAFHWWGEPKAGYYCLAKDDKLLRQHAEMLHAAGIDFVIIDSTNQANQAGAEAMIINPFSEMVKVWSGIPDAPKIVPWVPITGDGDMVAYFDRMLTEHPGLAFRLDGKPLILAMAPRSNPASPQFRALASRYTIRSMWGELNPGRLRRGEWSFMQPCRSSFKARSGNEECGQGVAYRDGVVEQVPVAAAYQRTYMSDTTTAVPKFDGRTLLRQLETAYRHPEAPIVTITGWNEWIAQRTCPQNRRQRCDDRHDTLRNGNKTFVDEFDADYNRDLEPGGGRGDYYYRLLKRAVALLRSGRDPMAALEGGAAPQRAAAAIPFPVPRPRP